MTAILRHDNDWVKERLPAARRKSATAFAEGVTLAAEALRGSWPVESLVLSEANLDGDSADRLTFEAHRRSVPVVTVSKRAMEKLSTLETPPGAGAIVSLPSKLALDADELPPRLLVLDGLADPGNVGTLVRTAQAFGFATALVEGGVSPLNEKMLRASSGVAFHPGALRQLAAARRAAIAAKVAVLLLDPHAPESLDTLASLESPIALVVGSEAHGIDRGAWPGARPVRISMRRGVESLNAAMSGAIALYELGKLP